MNVPEKVCSTAAVHFLVVSLYYAEPFVIGLSLFKILSVSHRELHMVPYVSAGSEKQCSEVEIMGIWVSSSPNLLMLSGSSRAQLYTYHFCSVTECCYSCPALWPVGSDNIWFMMNLSGHKISWWSTVKC